MCWRGFGGSTGLFICLFLPHTLIFQHLGTLVNTQNVLVGRDPQGSPIPPWPCTDPKGPTLCCPKAPGAAEFPAQEWQRRSRGCIHLPLWGNPSCTWRGNGFSRERAQEWRMNPLTATASVTRQILFGTRVQGRGSHRSSRMFHPAEEVMGSGSPDLSRKV